MIDVNMMTPDGYECPRCGGDNATRYGICAGCERDLEAAHELSNITVEREGTSWHWYACVDGFVLEGWTPGTERDARMHAHRCIESERARRASRYIEERRL